MLKRVSLTVLCLLAGGGALAACSSSVPTAKSATTTTAVAPTTTTPTTSAPPTTGASSTTTTTSTTASATTCVGSEMSVKPDASEGAAGTIELGFAVSNDGTEPCTLDGYPAISVLSGTTVLKASISHEGQGEIFTTKASSVTLPANGQASAGFVVDYSDVPVDGQSSCTKISDLDFTLPGVSSSSQVAESFSPCGAPNLSVSAVVSYARYDAEFKS